MDQLAHLPRDFRCGSFQSLLNTKLPQGHSETFKKIIGPGDTFLILRANFLSA